MLVDEPIVNKLLSNLTDGNLNNKSFPDSLSGQEVSDNNMISYSGVALKSETEINLDKLCRIGSTSRPYICVLIGDTEVNALVDRGSSRTYLNARGLPIIESNSIQIDKLKLGITCF